MRILERIRIERGCTQIRSGVEPETVLAQEYWRIKPIIPDGTIALSKTFRDGRWRIVDARDGKIIDISRNIEGSPKSTEIPPVTKYFRFRKESLFNGLLMRDHWIRTLYVDLSEPPTQRRRQGKKHR